MPGDAGLWEGFVSAFGPLFPLLTGVVGAVIAAMIAARTAREAAARQQIDAKTAWKHQRKTFKAQQAQERDLFERQLEAQREMFHRNLQAEREAAAEERAAALENEARVKAIEHAENLLQPVDHMASPNGLLFGERDVDGALRLIDDELVRMRHDIKFLPPGVQFSFEAISNFARLSALRAQYPDERDTRVQQVPDLAGVLKRLCEDARSSLMAYIMNRPTPGPTFLQNLINRNLEAVLGVQQDDIMRSFRPESDE